MRAQAEIQRAEVEQIRSHARSEFRLIRTADRRMLVACPKAAQIFVNASARSSDSPADVEVTTTF
jgi:hypothetical protein